MCSEKKQQQKRLDFVIIDFELTFHLFCQKMLEYLRDKKDVGFFLSIQALMQTCWSVFKRKNYTIFNI